MTFASVLCLATCRMRSNPCDTVARFCARPVLCWLAFPSAPALGSAGSAADRSALFTGFTATTAGSDFSRSCITGYGSSPSRCGPWGATRPSVERETSRFPYKERPHMPGSPTTPDRPGTRDHVRRPSCLPSSEQRRHPGLNSFAAQWLAYALPYRRFAHVLANIDARLGADVDRYSFIAVDLHHLLLAGLPAHSP